MEMIKVNTVRGYDFYKRFDEENNREVFNIQQIEYTAPEGGYFNPEYILGVKGFRSSDIDLFNSEKI